jgi:hypothetical protein
MANNYSIVKLTIVSHYDYVDIIEWCYDTLGPRQPSHYEITERRKWKVVFHSDGGQAEFTFLKSEDAVTFKLRWFK